MYKKLFFLTQLSIFMLFANEVICKESGNQMELNQCAYEHFLEADKELNRVYKALRKQGNKGYREKLKLSQRLWIKFRDAELELIFYCEEKNIRTCFGSMYPMIFNNKKAEITQRRVNVLKSYQQEEPWMLEQ